MRVQLALMVATPSSEYRESPALQLYALETVEDAVARGVEGIGQKDLHRLTGELDPFGMGELTTGPLAADGASG